MFEMFMSTISNFFGLKSFQLANKQAKSAAISSIKNALRLTEDHIDETRIGEFGGDHFEDVKSTEVVKAWSQAAQAVRPFDSDTASIFEYKADYWINPNGFKADVQQGLIQFDFRMRLNIVKRMLNDLEGRLK